MEPEVYLISGKGFVMKKHFSILIIILALWPYLVAFTPEPGDSSSTSVEIGVGTGSYAHVSRDCAGNVTGVTDIPFTDAGVSLDHKVKGGPLHVGAKAGIFSRSDQNRPAEPFWYDAYHDEVRQAENTARYINPNVGIEAPYIGVNFGVVFMDRMGGGIENRSISCQSGYDPLVHPSWKLRIGYLDSWYFQSSYYNNIPIVTGGGIIDFGVGFNGGSERSSFLVGLGAVPYDSPVLSIKYDYRIQEHIGLGLRASGHTGDATEYGLALTTRLMF
jgi:hypothetical protein